MNLQIKQKHQFYSEKHDVIFDILKMSNNECYVNLNQFELILSKTFEEYLRVDDIVIDARPSYLKACVYFDVFGYKIPEDFEKDMVLEIDNIKWYSFSYLCPYTAKYDEELSDQLCEFYRSLY